MDENKIEEVKVFNGPYVSGGSASLNQYAFHILGSKSERIVIYLCITLIAIFYIVYK